MGVFLRPACLSARTIDTKRRHFNLNHYVNLRKSHPPPAAMLCILKEAFIRLIHTWEHEDWWKINARPQKGKMSGSLQSLAQFKLKLNSTLIGLNSHWSGAKDIIMQTIMSISILPRWDKLRKSLSLLPISCPQARLQLRSSSKTCPHSLSSANFSNRNYVKNVKTNQGVTWSKMLEAPLCWSGSPEGFAFLVRFYRN